MNRYLIVLEARIPGEMDPEVRADLFARTKELLNDDWHRVVGKRAVAAITELDDPHEFISGLPLFPWLDVTLVALSTRN